METRKSRLRLVEFPAWALSIIANLLSWIFLMLLFDETGQNNYSVFYLFIISFLLVLFLTFACFMICRVHTKSIWYAPLICNIHLISSLIFEIPFWTRSLMVWIMLGIAILSSILGAMVGARKSLGHKNLVNK